MTQTAVAGSSWGAPPASERLRIAWQERHESDYIFRFATAFCWLVLTLGVYGFYILYQLMRRSRDHNQRRVQLLEAASAFAWEHAHIQAMTEELRPNFERIADRMRVLNGLGSEFRDPSLWVALAVVSATVAGFVGFVVIDDDLVRHEEAERAIEVELAAIYTRLGRPITAGQPAPAKDRHNVAGRIFATVATLGVYAIWWMRDLMIEGNMHFQQNWRFEDDLARAARSLIGVR